MEDGFKGDGVLYDLQFSGWVTGWEYKRRNRVWQKVVGNQWDVQEQCAEGSWPQGSDAQDR